MMDIDAMLVWERINGANPSEGKCRWNYLEANIASGLQQWSMITRGRIFGTLVCTSATIPSTNIIQVGHCLPDADDGATIGGAGRIFKAFHVFFTQTTSRAATLILMTRSALMNIECLCHWIWKYQTSFYRNCLFRDTSGPWAPSWSTWRRTTLTPSSWCRASRTWSSRLT